jgi:hypothetical protein
MTTITAIRKPRKKGIDRTYLVVLDDHDHSVRRFTGRPTQEEIKALGTGSYTLAHDDGQSIKDFTVVVNRNGNLQITGTTPPELEKMSTLNLNRLLRYYERIVKIWPAQARQVKLVTGELTRRQKLIN